MRDWWEHSRDEVLVPVTVLPEITYLLQHRVGPAAELAFTRAVAAGEFTLEPLLPEDVDRAANLLDAYSDAPLGFVDATVIAMAERLNVVSVLTTDRRHFSLVRPHHVAALRLLP